MPSRQSRPLSHCTANQRISCVSVRIRIFACAVHAPGHDEWGRDFTSTVLGLLEVTAASAAADAPRPPRLRLALCHGLGAEQAWEWS
jgi:hypothetical protein